MLKLFMLPVIFFITESALGLAKTSWNIVGKPGFVKEVADSPGGKNNYSLWVADDEGEVVYELNSKKQRMPASLTKLITATTVFKTLPLDHKFLTQIIVDKGSRQNISSSNTHAGPIYLKGGGDPSFVFESMWVLINQFSRTGVKTITGDVIVDESLFDNIYYSNGRQETRVDRAYDAPIGAMSFNWNSVNIVVQPGPKAGEKAKVFLEPSTPYLDLKNQTITVGRGQATKVTVTKISRGLKGDSFVVKGQIGIGADDKVIYKNISQPSLWSGYALIYFLKQRGITLQGTVKIAKAPKDGEVWAETESKPLPFIVSDMMKFSNNYIAEMFTKHLAKTVNGEPKTLEGGIKELRSHLRKMGWKKFVLGNPSGLTRKNQLAVEDLGQLLVDMKMKFRWFPEFVSSLPISGIDGTLKGRLKNSQAEGWVRAKTGMLNGVIGLAGYAGRKSGKVLTFVFIYNGSGKFTWAARDYFDRLALNLVR